MPTPERKWVANDGALFHTEEEAKAHEDLCLLTDVLGKYRYNKYSSDLFDHLPGLLAFFENEAKTVVEYLRRRGFITPEDFQDDDAEYDKWQL